MRIDLSKSLFILPNLFTLSSVLCGFVAILICTESATNDDLYHAALLIVIAMVFDAVDGRVARLTRTQSAIGLQLDSLADMISFGVAPAVLVYRWWLHELEALGIAVSFIYIACGAIRLARFNVMNSDATGSPKKPKKHTQGLPIPAAAGILISLVVANQLTELLTFFSPVFITIVVLALAIFMVSAMPFRSFKEIRLSWRTFFFISFALVSSGLIAHWYHRSIALVWLLACYVAMGIIESVWGLVQKPQLESDADEVHSPS